ncbi:choline monooxygenase [Pycnococcus provasolii]|uniref:Choline monooxygenase, chloroplastic n=1 Tax=Pycnococcus provasolii TaxID=41880 RepID=A0A830HB68_9CHLO|nr:choline monooxygenase [Pycnococcus provasolii]
MSSTSRMTMSSSHHHHKLLLLPRWPSRSSPLSRARTLPSRFYTQPSSHDAEPKSVFASGWILAAPLDDRLSTPNSYISTVVAGHRVIITRTSSSSLAAFYNSCIHHGAALVDESSCGHLDPSNDCRLVCPYHGWEYSGDSGDLKRATSATNIDWEKQKPSLKSIPVQALGSWVFVQLHPSQITSDVATYLNHDEVTTALKTSPQLSLENKHLVATETYQLDCNWKVFVDNYLDGGYHVPFAHPSLSDALDPSAYTNIPGARCSLQRTRGNQSDPRVGDADALYIWLYPHVMINAYGDGIIDTNVVIPISESRCAVTFEWFAPRGISAANVRRLVEGSDAVQREDMHLCRLVQNGLASPPYDDEGGRYAQPEEMMFRFHQSLYDDLQRHGYVEDI